MEKELFDYNDEWDQAGDWEILCYNVTLKVPIGEHPIGAKFDSATVDFQEGKIRLYKDANSEKHTSHKLILVPVLE